MFSGLAVAFEVALKRIAADRLLMSATFVTVLVATVILAVGPIYADAVSVAALQRSLAQAPVEQANLSIEARIPPELFDLVDGVVRGTVADVFAETGADVVAQIEAEAFELDGRSTEGSVALASLEYHESIQSRATIRRGEWPDPTGPPFEVALPSNIAGLLEIEVGEVFTVTSRHDNRLSASLRAVGLFEVDDARAPAWFADDLARLGLTEAGGFQTFGPMVVPLETMFESLTRGRMEASWRVSPRHEQLGVDDVAIIRARVSTLEARLDRQLFEAVGGDDSLSGVFTVRTDLPDLLSSVDRSLRATWSSVVAIVIQLALLAGYALTLTARLLANARADETDLLKVRGAGPRQVVAVAGIEGIVVSVPAALAGPHLASVLLLALNEVGPLAAIGIVIDPRPTIPARILAAVAAIVAVATVAWPAYRLARTSQGGGSLRKRQPSRSPAQRLGLDIALLALATVAFWQLSMIGPQISTSVRGRLGLDPLLVLAPSLALAAGAVLGLRVVPLLARTAEWIAASRRATVPTLASWQIARRPIRYAASSLLLMLAVGIGLFGAAYSATWTVSQRDQAAHDVGADIALRPDRAIGRSMPDLLLASTHESIDGVTASMPLLFKAGRFVLTGEPVQHVILDARKAGSVVDIRPDLAPEFGSLMDELAAARPRFAAVDLPGEPMAITVDLQAEEELPEPSPLDDEQPAPVAEPTMFSARLRLVIQDGDDILHRLVVGTIPVNEGPTLMGVDLASDDEAAFPSYPLRLVNLEIESQVPTDYPRNVELVLGGVSVVDRAGQSREVAVDWSEWEFSQRHVVGTTRGPSTASATASSSVVTLNIATGIGRGLPPAYFSLRPAGTELPPTYPVVVSAVLVDTGVVEVGDQIRLSALRIDNDAATVAGSIASFPSVDGRAGPAIIVDLPTLQMMSFEPGRRVDRPDAYWLSADGAEEEIIAVLEVPPFRSFSIESQVQVAESLFSDPPALATMGAMTISFVAAAVLAAIGFAVITAVSAMERLVEFALMRALGLSPRQLAGWLILEQGSLVVVSLTLGTAIGILVAATILPLVTVTGDGSPAVPSVIVMYPCGTIVTLELAMLAALTLIVSIMTLALRRVGLGSLLRLGQD